MDADVSTKQEHIVEGRRFYLPNAVGSERKLSLHCRGLRHRAAMNISAPSSLLFASSSVVLFLFPPLSSLFAVSSSLLSQVSSLSPSLACAFVVCSLVVLCGLWAVGVSVLCWLWWWFRWWLCSCSFSCRLTLPSGPPRGGWVGAGALQSTLKTPPCVPSETPASH